MKTVPRILILLLAVAACEAPPSTAPQAGEPQGTNPAQQLSASEQAILTAVKAGEDAGAILNRDYPCSLSPGFGDQNGTVAFGGLMAEPGPNGICPLSNFERTNPDGTVDVHQKGVGAFFLLVFEPFTIFGSEGSHVRWTSISHENGIRVFNVSGTLSDGSRVRVHFVTDPNGDNKPANTLWVEGLGYIVGGPEGR